MTHEATPTILTTVPTAVQRLIRWHLGVLCEITQGIVQARAMERVLPTSVRESPFSRAYSPPYIKYSHWEAL